MNVMAVVGVERVVSVGYNRLYRVISDPSFRNVFVRMDSIVFSSLCLYVFLCVSCCCVSGPGQDMILRWVDCLRLAIQVR